MSLSFDEYSNIFKHLFYEGVSLANFQTICEVSDAMEGARDYQRKGLWCINLTMNEMFFTRNIEDIFLVTKYLQLCDEDGFSRWMDGDDIEIYSQVPKPFITTIVW